MDLLMNLGIATNGANEPQSIGLPLENTTENSNFNNTYDEAISANKVTKNVSSKETDEEAERLDRQISAESHSQDKVAVKPVLAEEAEPLLTEFTLDELTQYIADMRQDIISEPLTTYDLKEELSANELFDSDLDMDVSIETAYIDKPDNDETLIAIAPLEDKECQTLSTEELEEIASLEISGLDLNAPKTIDTFEEKSFEIKADIKASLKPQDFQMNKIEIELPADTAQDASFIEQPLFASESESKELGEFDQVLMLNTNMSSADTQMLSENDFMFAGHFQNDSIQINQDVQAQQIKEMPSIAVNQNFTDEVAHRALWLVKGGVQQASISLSPPELGPLEIKITISNNKAEVSFIAETAQVRDILNDSANRLREMFQSEGLNLTDVDVSDRSASDRSQKSDKPNQADNSIEAEIETPMVSTVVKKASGLDLFV